MHCMNIEYIPDEVVIASSSLSLSQHTTLLVGRQNREFSEDTFALVYPDYISSLHFHSQ